MACKLFGTDGIRGTANTYPMTGGLAFKLAQSAAIALNRGDHRHKVVIGKDTRLSGYMLEPAMVSGFISMGLDVVLVGPMPTPAIAMLTKSLRADLGVMISASHNPHEDNGIKLFGADGYKLSDEIEAKIEGLIEDDLTEYLVPAADMGRARRLEDAPGRYIEFVKSTFPKGLRLDGFKIALDCAHGAAYKIAPEVLYELGAEIIPIGVSPDGTNINKNCGATHTDILCETIVQHQADIGIALDGDADRVIICDETGHVIDGDQIMGLIARNWAQDGRLVTHKLAATVMSNLGLAQFLEKQNIEIIRTPVGDRHVVEAMRRDNIQIGGEQSGHIILGEHCTTGDGIIAALEVLATLAQNTDKKASSLCRVFDRVPQILKNVRVQDKSILSDKGIIDFIKSAEGSLDGKGRILVRPSGTEPLIRVMGEAENQAKISKIVDEISAKLIECDGGSESVTALQEKATA